MPEYIKLTEPGSSHTFVCKTVTVSTTGKWPDLNFLAETGEIVTAPKNALDRELPKMKLTDWQQVIGMALTVSRSVKLGANGKPFWDCALAAGGYARPEPPRPSLTAAAKAEAERIRKAKGLPAEEEEDREIPPPTDADNPYADAAGEAQEGEEAPEAIPVREAIVNAAYARAWAVARAVQGEDGTPESVQAGAATILIAYRV
jgi:hypothetical protein